MDKAKIRLSPKEAELVFNADWILTKNGILQKAKYLLEQLQFDQQQFLQSHTGMLPPEVTKTSPKISKGENYKGLPYLVLDYPRYFEENNHFAIRSMFWWGNFFSITLYLSGEYKKRYEKKLESHYSELKEESFFIGISADPWQHHFETDNYLSLRETDAGVFRKFTADKEFIKLAKMYPLDQWETAGELLLASFSKIISWMVSEEN
jgi:hypothetical protein